MTEKELKKNYIRGIIKASDGNEELLVNEILELCSKQYRLGLAQGKFETAVEFQQLIDKAINFLDLFIFDENMSKYDTLKILLHQKKILQGEEME